MKAETKPSLKEERIDKMLSSPILKGLTSFLSSLDAISAVYDVDFNLASTDSEDFFNELDISAVKSNPPTRGETTYTVTVNGEKMILSVTPIFKSKRIITAYIFIVRTDYQLYKQICAGSMPEYFTMLMNKIREEIADCHRMNEIAQNTSASKKLVSLLEEQKRVLKDLYSELDRTRCDIFPDSKSGGRINCNVSVLLNNLCVDASECLKDVKRKANLDIDTRNSYSNIVDFNLFTSAFSNILMYHLHYSPLKSTVSIKSAVNADRLLELTIKTKNDSKTGESAQDAARAKYFRDLAYKIICYNFGGECEINNVGDTVITIIKLPVSMKNRGPQLTSKNSPYLGSDYKPMHENLSYIIKSESSALKKQKDSKKSGKE